MALKPLRIATSEAPKKSASDVKIIEVEGQVVTDYNSAVINLKDAEAKKKEVGAALQECGLPELWEVCLSNPDAAPSSVKLRDELGSTVLIIGMNKYSVIDPEAATPTFEALGASIEDHVQYTVQAKFDSSVFLAQEGASGEVGSFSTKIYNEYKKACDLATAKLIQAGLLPVGAVTPLSTAQVAAVKPDFHQRRWRAFPSVEQQKALHEACPYTVALKPVVEGTGDAPQATVAKKKVVVSKRKVAAA
jgi:hypothetical protein